MPGDTDFLRDLNPDNFGEGRRRRKRYLEDEPKGSDDSGYYDVPMLKPPVWTWEITAYFYLGGISAGSYILSRLAERFGGDAVDSRALARRGAAISALAALPCAPLLISDLGDRTRFHHMLRIWKPTSPMNFGSWVLTGYSPLTFLAGLRVLLQTAEGKAAVAATLNTLLKRADPTLAFTSDVAGIPLALLLAGYTGVLLSSTSIPIWSRNPYIGPLFSASAMGSAAAACRLALEPREDESPVSEALGKVEVVAHAAEALALAGYIREAGPLAEPITKGPLRTHLWGDVVAVGLALPVVLEAIPAPPKVKKWLRVAASVAGLIGGIGLRYMVVKAGTLSANDPKYNREATRETRSDGIGG